MKQIYLIGLKFYTTHQWPYFGPDVDYSGAGQVVQLPGALQGLLVGVPLFVWPVPESPYIFLNLLSFASLCFLAWYCCRRLPQIPRWIVWGWLFTAPWTLEFSTQPVNPSYVLFGAVLFFVGAFETYPFLTRKIIPPTVANVMMGFAFFWIMQLHMSWPVLVPYLLLSIYFQYRQSRWKVFAQLAAGGMFTLALLIPTYAKYGLAQGMGNTNAAFTFNLSNLRRFANPVEGILGWFLSYASFEVPRFIGAHTAQRLSFLREHYWIVPFAVFLGVTGIVQAASLLFLWWLKRDPSSDWRKIKYFTLASVGLLYAGFLFTGKSPQPHTFYLVLPVSMIYGFHCWSALLREERWRRFSMLLIVCGIVFNVGVAAHRFSRESIYVHRSLVQAAIDQQDYTVVGERRPGAR